MCKKSTNFHDGVKVFPRFLLYVIQEYFFSLLIMVLTDVRKRITETRAHDINIYI